MKPAHIDLTAEELEEVLLALKERVQHRRAAGQLSTVTEALIARLEECQRDQRRQGS